MCTFDKVVVGIIVIKIEKKNKFNFQAMLSPLSPSLHLKVPIMLPVPTTYFYTWKETEVHLGSFFSFV